MPSYSVPYKNEAYLFYVALTSQTKTKVNQANPTLATGDAKVSIDGAAQGDLICCDGAASERVCDAGL